MARSRTDVLNELVELIHTDTLHIKIQNKGRQLDDKTARTVAHYTHTMSVVDRNMTAKEKDADAETKALTDEELEAELLKAAKQVEARRGAK